MKLTLAIETSSAAYGIAVFDAWAVHAVCRLERTDPTFVNVGELAARCVTAAGTTFDTIGQVSVDLGPGNLNSTRAGLAYANGLAFSLGVNVVGTDSLRLLALTVATTTGIPVLSVRKAANHYFYAALFTLDGRAIYRYGLHSEIVRLLATEHDVVVLAGSEIAETGRFLDEVAVIDSGITVPDVSAQQLAIKAGYGIPKSSASLVTEATFPFARADAFGYAQSG